MRGQWARLAATVQSIDVPTEVRLKNPGREQKVKHNLLLRLCVRAKPKVVRRVSHRSLVRFFKPTIASDRLADPLWPIAFSERLGGNKKNTTLRSKLEESVGLCCTLWCARVLLQHGDACQWGKNKSHGGSGDITQLVTGHAGREHRQTLILLGHRNSKIYLVALHNWYTILELVIYYLSIDCVFILNKLRIKVMVV